MESINQFITTVFDTHPWHVPTTHFPIALTGVALLFLILALLRRNETLERAAFFNMALAVVTIVLAGLTGYRDHIVRFEGETAEAGTKIFLTISLFILTSVITVSRWRKPDLLWQPSTMILYLIGFAASFMLASTLGFIGGLILYGY
jgi:uncharacterized membrane protein